MRSFYLFLSACFWGLSASGQESLQKILDSVEANSLSISANKKLAEYRMAEYSTGLSLYDPQIEYDYLIGAPKVAGIQREFAVSQRMDFPTTYGKKRELLRRQGDLSDAEILAFRQQYLLQAKLLVLEIIYYNKKEQILRDRMQKTTGLVNNYERKLENGEATILDMNKVRLQLMNLQHDMALNENDRLVRKSRLAELNGGRKIEVTDSEYPLLPVLPGFEILDSLIESNDPVMKVHEQQLMVLQQQLSVQKALNLPKLEAGYHSQRILGGSFRGVHTGISIPLWENRNRLEAVRANIAYAQTNMENHRVEHRMENKQWYDQLSVRARSMLDFKTLYQSLNTPYLLEKSLQLGEISIIDFVAEVSYYYSTQDRYLQLELEYHEAMANLYRFAL